MKLVITVYNQDILAIVLNLENGKEIRLPRDNKSTGRIFGITYDAKKIYLASDRGIVSYDKNFNKGQVLFEQNNNALHQILAKKKMWITNPYVNGLHHIKRNKTNELFLLNRNMELVRSETYPNTHQDTNHINSIFIDKHHLYISCHNKKNPSFIAKYTYPELKFVNKSVMGTCIHNILVCPDRIWTLDSAGSRSIISTKNDSVKLGTEKNFLRGLSVTPKHFIVGKFAFNLVRKNRFVGNSEVLIVSRKTHHIEHKFILKDTGELNDMRLMDVYDECHGIKPIWS